MLKDKGHIFKCLFFRWNEGLRKNTPSLHPGTLCLNLNICNNAQWNYFKTALSSEKPFLHLHQQISKGIKWYIMNKRLRRNTPSLHPETSWTFETMELFHKNLFHKFFIRNKFQRYKMAQGEWKVEKKYTKLHLRTSSLSFWTSETMELFG